ncbi:MAG: winged helix-turn-helix transcriptional regulator [Acidimicrobiales bacterium]
MAGKGKDPLAPPGSAVTERRSGDGLDRALAAVGDRWTLRIVHSLAAGPCRFGELAEQLEGISPNILTGRLRQLERDGLLAAAPYSQRPLRLAYSLTDAGLQLQGAIALLAAWGARQRGQADGPRHRDCGTELEATLFCPTCERSIESPTEENLHWL